MKKLLLLFVTLLTSSLFFGKAYAEPITVSSNDFTVSIDNIQFYDFDFNIQPADHIYKYIVGIRSQEMLHSLASIRVSISSTARRSCFPNLYPTPGNRFPTDCLPS